MPSYDFIRESTSLTEVHGGIMHFIIRRRISLGFYVTLWAFVAACDRADVESAARLSETHPFQADLFCRRAAGNTVNGQLYTHRDGKDELISSYESGHVGTCELARRAARKGFVCVESRGQYQLFNLAMRKPIRSFGRDFQSCVAESRGWATLDVAEGFARFIPEAELRDVLKHQPSVADPELERVLRSPDTMWYDEASMVFVYQDSFGNPQGPEGLRANRVGYDTGFSSNVPDIRALMDYFEPERFKFPFSIAQGGHEHSQVYVLNFWAPPKSGDGKPLPVLWWRNGSHWHWTFPVGTVIGEALLQQDPASPADWYVFEYRVRTRELNSWKTDIFRPFTSAREMADAVKESRPGWESTDLGQLVTHLENNDSLVPGRLESKPYGKIFPSVDGAWDYLPATSDHDLIREFLTTRIFTSSMGRIWKSNQTLTTYAAGNQAGFQIVPEGYIGGLLKPTEEACSRCHEQTGRPLGQLDRRVVLYGEIWGEDQIFTWHPFEVSTDIFTVSDGSRRENKRLLAAGLIRNLKPAADDPDYRELARPYTPVYRIK